MMLLILKSFLTFLALLATCVLLPQLPLALLRLVLRAVGWAVQKRTRSRREYIVSRVRAEEEELARKRSTKPASTEDEDWEKVDTSSSASSGTAGTRTSDDWNGIIGFFHPFWYVPSLYTCLSKIEHRVATPEVEVNVSSGKP